MTSRRSLNSAFAMPDAALAFIHDTSSQAGEQQSSPSNGMETSKRLSAPTAVERRTSLAGGAKQEVRLRHTRGATGEGDSDHAVARPSLLGEVRVPLTTRLQSATADALRRANLEQRLKRLRPATQQDIVEIAVHEWLKRHGYLDS